MMCVAAAAAALKTNAMISPSTMTAARSLVLAAGVGCDHRRDLSRAAFTLKICTQVAADTNVMAFLTAVDQEQL